MNTQNNRMEQLETKIKELVPSLLELSFGCYVKSGNSTLMYIGEGLYWNVEAEMWGNHTSSTIIDEVLGHPIQLHHVLQALSKTWIYVDATGAFYDISGNGEELKCFWKLDKDLRSQSQETIDFLTTLINQ